MDIAPPHHRLLVSQLVILAVQLDLPVVQLDLLVNQLVLPVVQFESLITLPSFPQTAAGWHVWHLAGVDQVFKSYSF